MRAILFDKDGTLIDFDASWGPAYWRLALDLAEGDEDRALAMLVAGGMDAATSRFAPGALLAAGNTLDIVQLWFPALAGDARVAMIARIDTIFHENGITCSVPVAGLDETLTALAAMGLQMGVATNDGTESAIAALTALGVADHLPQVYGYDSVARPKPAPDQVLAYAAAISADPAEIAVVGDNVHDLEMARAAGAGLAVGVLSGTGDEAASGTACRRHIAEYS